jgi:hypothetical protein
MSWNGEVVRVNPPEPVAQVSEVTNGEPRSDPADVVQPALAVADPEQQRAHGLGATPLTRPPAADHDLLHTGGWREDKDPSQVRRE